MKVNPGIFQVMVLEVYNKALLNLNVTDKIIPCPSEVKVLVIIIDNELRFKKQVGDLCKKLSFKLCALQKIRRYLTVGKARLLANAFIDSQFNYTPLI